MLHLANRWCNRGTCAFTEDFRSVLEFLPGVPAPRVGKTAVFRFSPASRRPGVEIGKIERIPGYFPGGPAARR
jgi:hypothetical protein